MFLEINFVPIIFGGPTNSGKLGDNTSSFIFWVDRSGIFVVLSTSKSISRSTWVEPVMWADDLVVILDQLNKLDPFIILLRNYVMKILKSYVIYGFIYYYLGLEVVVVKGDNRSSSPPSVFPSVSIKLVDFVIVTGRVVVKFELLFRTFLFGIECSFTTVISLLTSRPIALFMQFSNAGYSKIIQNYIYLSKNLTISFS